MNARIIALIVVVLALVGGGVAFVSSQSGSAPVAQASAVPTKNPSLAPSSPPPPTVAPTPTPTLAPTPSPAPATPSPVPTPTKFTISGKVTDAQTGNPVSGIFIYVHQVAACPNNIGGSASTGTVTGMITATDGTYKIQPIDPGTYLVRIGPTVGSGYSVVWWNGKSDCTTADKVVLQQNMTGIDFALRHQ